MKFLQGKQLVAQESITSVMLMRFGISNPDYIPTIMRLYPQYSALNKILDLKGKRTNGINNFTNNSRYRTVGSNHIKYRVDENDETICSFVAGPDGASFVDSLNPTKPGFNGSQIILYANSNWGGFHETIELSDGETQLHIQNDPEEVTGGVYKIIAKLIRSNESEYVDPTLLAVGMEYTVRMNMHEHDFSERGVEKYSFKGWGDTFLTLQRFKYSWSGTAAAMMKNGKPAVEGYWVSNGTGQNTFLTTAEDEMMSRATKSLNYQYIFGKSTVSYDTNKVLLMSEKGREIIGGSGIVFSNDGPIRIPYNSWTKSFLQNLITQIFPYLRPDQEGLTEVVALMAPRAYMSFMALMGELGKTVNNNIVGDGASKGINDTYSYYELGGVRIIVEREDSLVARAGAMMSDGSRDSEWDTILVPLGNTTGNNNGVELVQLRPAVEGTVAGIDAGGNIASSVDGSSKHLLFQNGIINQNKIFWLRKTKV